MATFRMADAGLHLAMEPQEAGVLRVLVRQVDDLVRPPAPASDDPIEQLADLGEDVEAPRDPALRRLFPDAYRDDDEASAEFRRYTLRGQRQERSDRADLVLGLVSKLEEEGTVVVATEHIPDLVRVLNDLRLVIGTRLGITAEGAEGAEDQPMLGAYEWLTALQVQVLQTIGVA